MKLKSGKRTAARFYYDSRTVLWSVNSFLIHSTSVSPAARKKLIDAWVWLQLKWHTHTHTHARTHARAYIAPRNWQWRVITSWVSRKRQELEQWLVIGELWRLHWHWSSCNVRFQWLPIDSKQTLITRRQLPSQQLPSENALNSFDCWHFVGRLIPPRTRAKLPFAYATSRHPS
jgi:hypothetical protein